MADEIVFYTNPQSRGLTTHWMLEEIGCPYRLEVKAYVHNLYEHLACCDLALVQGGLSTCMELIASRKPFLNFPLQRHFEQLIHVQRRLRNYGADCALDYNEVTPEILADRALDTLHKPVNYRPVETDGASGAARMIAHVLSNRAAVR